MTIATRLLAPGWTPQARSQAMFDMCVAAFGPVTFYNSYNFAGTNKYAEFAPWGGGVPVLSMANGDTGPQGGFSFLIGGFTYVYANNVHEYAGQNQASLGWNSNTPQDQPLRLITVTTERLRLITGSCGEYSILAYFLLLAPFEFWGGSPTLMLNSGAPTNAFGMPNYNPWGTVNPDGTPGSETGIYSHQTSRESPYVPNTAKAGQWEVMQGAYVYNERGTCGTVPREVLWFQGAGFPNNREKVVDCDDALFYVPAGPYAYAAVEVTGFDFPGVQHFPGYLIDRFAPPDAVIAPDPTPQYPSTGQCWPNPRALQLTQEGDVTPDDTP